MVVVKAGGARGSEAGRGSPEEEEEEDDEEGGAAKGRAKGRGCRHRQKSSTLAVVNLILINSSENKIYIFLGMPFI